MRDALPQMGNTPEIRFDCAENRKFKVIEEVRARLRRDCARRAHDKAAPGLEGNDVDGVRVTTADGWWLMRASNTQAVIVVRAEASSPAGLERVKQQLAAELAPSGLALPPD